VGESARREAAHVDHHFDLIGPEEVDKLFPGPIAGAQSKYAFFNRDYFVQREGSNSPLPVKVACPSVSDVSLFGSFL
jgi:hypothetical protein